MKTLNDLSPALRKELKNKLRDLNFLRNKAIASFSFDGMRTWDKLITQAGRQRNGETDTEWTRAIVPADINEFYKNLAAEIEQNYLNPPAPVAAEKHPVTQALDDVAEDPPLADHEKLTYCPEQKCVLFPFQERAAVALLDGFLNKHYSAMMLLAPVGTGKTFVIGAVQLRLQKADYYKDSFSIWPAVYVTKSSIVEQTSRVLENFFGQDTYHACKVLNIEQLRSQFGSMMVRPETRVVGGEEVVEWKWRPGIHPRHSYWDECQILKNTDSTQSQIAQAYTNAPGKTSQLFFSATPFMRVCEAKCFAVATGLSFDMGGGKQKLTDETWPLFAKMVASPAEPDEYSPAAIDRLMKYLDPYIVQIKGVRPQFNALNRIQMIDFATPEEEAFYRQAWDRYLAEIAKIQGIEGLDKAQSYFAILVQFLKFRMAAELIRAEHMADAMHAMVQAGKAAVCAVNFKGTIRKVVEILHDKHDVPREMISLIWGGGKTAPSKKQKAKQKIMSNDALAAVLKQAGIGLDVLDLDEVEDYIEEKERPELALGAQSLKQRQKEIDAFQSGKSLYCLFSFKSGGVGLSLHHSDELTAVKCPRKKNGWYVKEEIHKVPTRQREVILAPTYSAIELVQGLGRAPRLTSMSDTTQVIVFYRGTIEEKVAEIVSKKLRCLRRVVRTRESWEDVIVGGVPDNEQKFHVPDDVVQKHLTNNVPDDEPGDSSVLGDVAEEDESETE